MDWDRIMKLQRQFHQQDETFVRRPGQPKPAQAPIDKQLAQQTLPEEPNK